MKTSIPFLFTADLEEFDLPLEYGHTLPWATQAAISLQGLERLQLLLQNLGIEASFFITATWAREFPGQVAALAQLHEIASHGPSHGIFEAQGYLDARITLEKISGTTISGFRMPRMAPVNYQLLKLAGYRYDSSLNPTCLPGKYNNTREPRLPFLKEGIAVLPSSVTPVFRIPFFWLSFKNFPAWINWLIARRLLQNKIIVFYLHPWEFADIGNIPIPFYIKRPCGFPLVQKLQGFLSRIRPEVDFMSCSRFVSTRFPDGQNIAWQQN